MPIEYVSVEDAIARNGLRMVVVGNVPSPWGEAAKGILRLKAIDWAAVRLVYDSEPLKQWAGQRTGPVAIYDNEPPRAGWAEILLLAERLAPTPSLRAGRRRRARHDVRPGARDLRRGWPGLGAPPAARPRRPAEARRLLRARLAVSRPQVRLHPGHRRRSRRQGSRPAPHAGGTARRSARRRRYYLGNSLTAVDIYSATFMALFRPLPPEHCAMDAGSRAAMETRDPATDAALDPILLRHRDMMYAEHLELPLSL